MVIASMLGTGILTNSGPILKSTGSYSALFMLWGLGGVLALLGAISLAEMGSALPLAGGDYVFVKKAFGPACGFVYGWSMVLLGFAAPTALISYTAATYVHPVWLTWFGDIISEKTFTVVAAATLITLFTALHSLGQRTSTLLQGIATTFNFLVLFGFAMAASWFGVSRADRLSLQEPLSEVPIPLLATGFVQVMYAYTGWNAAVYLSGEIKNPRKMVALCLVTGILAVTVLYLGMNVMYSLAISIDEIKILGESDLNRLAEVAVKKLLGTSKAHVFSLLVSAGVIASLSAYILTGPRIIYAMAADGLFPSIGKKINVRTGTPVLATILQSCSALIFLFSGTFGEIMNFVSYGLTALGVFIVLPIFILRRSSKISYKPGYFAYGYPWSTILFLLITVAILVFSAKDAPLTALLSLASIFIGFPIYWLLRRLGAFRS